MSNLRTDYQDDVFTGSRKYHMTDNGDGTVSFTDQTEYTQVGDTYGAAQINEINDILNNLDDKTYLKDDSVETEMADNDYVPFLDTSASGGKRITWENIKNLLKSVLAIKDHASNTASTYGAGTASQFGHVKLSDTYLTSGGAATNSVGASSAAVNSAYNKINDQLKANNNEIYMDYKNGKYGYNTSANRGADTFHPFSSATEIVADLPKSLTTSCAHGDGFAYGSASISVKAQFKGRVSVSGDGKVRKNSGSESQSVSFVEGDTLTFSILKSVTSGESGSASTNITWTIL